MGSLLVAFENMGNGRRVSLDSTTDGSVTGDTAADAEAETSPSEAVGMTRESQEPSETGSWQAWQSYQGG